MTASSVRERIITGLYQDLFLRIPIRPEFSHNLVIHSSEILNNPPVILENVFAPLRKLLRRELIVADPGLEFRREISTPSGANHDFYLPRRFGIAAGFIKNAEPAATEFTAQLGAGSLELGTVTLEGRKGNPNTEKTIFPDGKIRKILRLVRKREVMPDGTVEVSANNHMGLPVKNIGEVIENYRKGREKLKTGNFDMAIGVNIAPSPECATFEEMIEDFKQSLRMFAEENPDWITINPSCPNTYGIKLSKIETMIRLMEVAAEAVKIYSELPLLVKLPPNMSEEDLKTVVVKARELGISGFIGVNTTPVNKEYFEGYKGGASGRILRPEMMRTVALLRKIDDEEIEKIEDPVVRSRAKKLLIGASGGITYWKNWDEARRAGADFSQAVTGFIGAGPYYFRNLADGEIATTSMPRSSLRSE